MSEQLDLFSGTAFERQEPVKTAVKPPPPQTIEGRQAIRGESEAALVAFAKRWPNSIARDSLDNDFLKFVDGAQLGPIHILEYHTIIHKTMRLWGISSKKYVVEGYGTTKTGFARIKGKTYLRFAHRDTRETIEVEAVMDEQTYQQVINRPGQREG